MALQTGGYRLIQHPVVSQYLLHKLTESPLSAVCAGDILHLALHIVGRIDRRTAETHQAQQRQVVEVVANEGHLIQPDAQLLTQRPGLRPGR